MVGGMEPNDVSRGASGIVSPLFFSENIKNYLSRNYPNLFENNKKYVVKIFRYSEGFYNEKDKNQAMDGIDPSYKFHLKSYIMELTEEWTEELTRIKYIINSNRKSKDPNASEYFLYLDASHYFYDYIIIYEDGGETLYSTIESIKSMSDTLNKEKAIDNLLKNGIPNIIKGLKRLIEINYRYNDLHLENIVFDGTTLKLIDFERLAKFDENENEEYKQKELNEFKDMIIRKKLSENWNQQIQQIFEAENKTNI
jgi:hypothetical protein